jgi:hypothetical protein
VLNSAALELGVLGGPEDVRDNADGSRDVLAEALGVVNRLFTLSVSIEEGTEILHLDLEGALGATALKSHMPKEVSRGIGVSVSAREPASIHTPTVAVWAHVCQARRYG